MLPLTLPILRLLSDGEFHSGALLAATLGVSRASICHALRDTDLLGVTIYKVRGRGYRLSTPIEWLKPDEIKKHAGRSLLNSTLQIVDVVESTNSLLMQTVSDSAEFPKCVVAEIQTRGRGRRGRAWHGSLGGSLTFSVLWRFNAGVAQLSGLSLVVGVALVRAMTELGLSNLQLKWPNDLLYDFQKLGGVLIELHGDALGPSATVIGVGLNIQLTESVKHQIDQAVIDLNSLNAGFVARNKVLGVALRHIFEVLTEFEKYGFEPFRQEWQTAHAYHDKTVAMRMPDGSETIGLVRGVSNVGAIVLETASGERRFGSGEISMRPMSLAPTLKNRG